MRRLSMLVAVVGAVAMVPGAAADGGCGNTDTSVPGVAYVDDRGDGDIWVYAESTGDSALQAGGESVLGYTDGCDDGPGADTLVY